MGTVLQCLSMPGFLGGAEEGGTWGRWAVHGHGVGAALEAPKVSEQEGLFPEQMAF